MLTVLIKRRFASQAAWLKQGKQNEGCWWIFPFAFPFQLQRAHVREQSFIGAGLTSECATGAAWQPFSLWRGAAEAG